MSSDGKTIEKKSKLKEKSSTNLKVNRKISLQSNTVIEEDSRSNTTKKHIIKIKDNVNKREKFNTKNSIDSEIKDLERIIALLTKEKENIIEDKHSFDISTTSVAVDDFEETASKLNSPSSFKVSITDFDSQLKQNSNTKSIENICSNTEKVDGSVQSLHSENNQLDENFKSSFLSNYQFKTILNEATIENNKPYTRLSESNKKRFNENNAKVQRIKKDQYNVKKGNSGHGKTHDILSKNLVSKWSV